MSRSWSSFCSRRSVSPAAFLTVHNITDSEGFIAKLNSMGIVPPAGEEIAALFPPPPPPVKEVTIAEITPEKEANPIRTATRSKSRHGEEPAEGTTGNEPGVPTSGTIT